MFRDIDGNRLDFTVLQCPLTGQLKWIVSGQRLFDPSDGAADGALRATIVDGEVFHRAVFSIVL